MGCAGTLGGWYVGCRFLVSRQAYLQRHLIVGVNSYRKRKILIMKIQIKRSAFDSQEAVRRNARIHDKIANEYDLTHGEIFNDVEQQRLSCTLTRLLALISGGSKRCHALDFGCGTGNLTNRLTRIGCDVTAADISKDCLEVVRARYGCNVVLLDNGSTATLKNDSYDLVCAYSVLHHVPDYLSLLKELHRVCKPGGIIFIDHEKSPMYWERLNDFADVYSRISRVNWRKYTRVSNYVHKLKSLFIERYSSEGDIHVWPDDHIEWDKIDVVFKDLGHSKVLQEDFLLFKGKYIESEYSKFKDRFLDTRCAAYKLAR